MPIILFRIHLGVSQNRQRLETAPRTGSMLILRLVMPVSNKVLKRALDLSQPAHYNRLMANHQFACRGDIIQP
jgi:hypothetical protein